MSVRGKRPANRRRTEGPANTGSAKAEAPKADWQLADDQLDEALRETFPASDALSVVQNTRCT